MIRGLLAILLPFMAYGAFTPEFSFNCDHLLWSLGWPRDHAFPYEAVAHALAAMLLTWLLPAACVLGDAPGVGWGRLKTPILVLIVALSAWPIEYFQAYVDRSYFNVIDIFWHQVGVVMAGVIWLLAAIVPVPAGRLWHRRRGFASRRKAEEEHVRQQ